MRQDDTKRPSASPTSTNDARAAPRAPRPAAPGQAGPGQLNGLEPRALEALVARVARDPSCAPARFEARSSWLGRFSSRAQITECALGGARVARRHTLRADEPAELLGEDSAPNPQEMLLAALNACMLVGFAAGATARGIKLESLSVESSLELDLRGVFGVDPGVPPGAERVRYSIEVEGDATPEQFAEIHAEVMARSPNRFHLAAPLAFDAQLIVR